MQQFKDPIEAKCDGINYGERHQRETSFQSNTEELEMAAGAPDATARNPQIYVSIDELHLSSRPRNSFKHHQQV